MSTQSPIGEQPGQGAGPPHAGWSVPPNPYPYPYPPPPPLPVDRGRNGFAVAGLVLGIIPITGILGIVFGLIGRSQATKQGQKGRVMGTWGAALGAVTVVLIVIGIVGDSVDNAERDRNGQVSQSGEESAFSLRVGDCLRTLPADSSEVEQVDLVKCTSAHNGEVYARITLTGSSYPGDKATASRSESRCVSEFEPFVGKAYDDSSYDLFFLRPTSSSWAQGDREVTCLISGTDLVGTAKGSHR